MKPGLIFFLSILMSYTAIAQSTGAPQRLPPFSKSSSGSGLLFVSGQVGIEPQSGQLVKASFAGEARQALRNVGSVLGANGLRFANLVSVTVYLEDMANYGTLNEVYREFVQEPFPARVCLAVRELPSGAHVEVSAIAAYPQDARETVRAFLAEVRSGKDPDKASVYMADTVLAHQLHSEKPFTVKRTPAQYAGHVREFKRLFGDYQLEIVELLADGDKVYVRWKQTGKHLAEIDGFAPTGRPLVEFTSVVYRVADGRIVEYWLQMDRLGFDLQLQQAKSPKE
ncbi:MAG: hypothetical protein EOO15_09105 [Chitinophagaceae bacterium]|nr:MAG: hypothetical protein EOO15_09105 [Chitinophagaceae bacterium]